jgi:Kef-type K+ transport system membrane component KefB
VVGFVAGPSALGLVGGAELARFAPLALLATGWIALLVGLTFGVDGERRIGAGSIALGLVVGLVSFSCVAGAVWWVLDRVPSAGALFPDPQQRIVLSACVGAALADTSRHVARWAAERLDARGPVLDRVSGVTRSDDLLSIAALSLIISLDTSRGVQALPAAGIVLGGLLGVTFAALLGRTLRPAVFWALLFGFSLLAAGISARVDVSVLASGFSLGLALAMVSPLRAQARKLAGGVEGAVILPALFLAGARTPGLSAPALWVLGAALLARLASGLLAAALVAAVDSRARRAGPALALAFLSTGPLGIAIALSVELRYPGPFGDLVLAITVVAAVAGEFIGPPALRRALRRTGELPA